MTPDRHGITDSPVDEAAPAGVPKIAKRVVNSREPAALRSASAAPAAPSPQDVIPPPTQTGEEPPAIHVRKPPGTDGEMDVVVAAEVIRRINRTRQTVSLVSQVIIRAYEEEALHAEVCRHLVAFGGYLMAWIGLAEDKPERLVRPVAHAGLEPNFLGALKITWTNDLANRSPTSLAIQEQRPHVARNILKEPRFAVLRKDAQLYGYTATCALPLQFAQYGMGVLTIHAMEPDAFNAEEVSLLRELANDLAAGVIGMRERAKRQLLEERLAGVVDATDDAIIGLDANGDITDWNAGAARLFGWTRQEAVGHSMGKLIVPSDVSADHERVRQAMARGERVGRFETLRTCKEGKLIHTSASATPIFGADGVVVGATYVEHDITSAKAAEAGRQAVKLEESEVLHLKALEASRKVFMSEASHELNTPLTPLRIHIDALSSSKDLTEKQRAHLVVIERNTLRLCNIVRDMLEASRLETGRFKLDVSDVLIEGLIEDALKSFQEQADAGGVTLEGHPSGRLVVSADRNRVSQVLYNLVGNAIKFTPAGGHVEVLCGVEDGMVVVRVVDTGVGLSPEQLGQLFLPFSRPHESVGPAPKGTGLGLFISKGVVEQHGGRIWAESAGPGKGSTFCFSLPLAFRARPVGKDAEESAAPTATRPRIVRRARASPNDEVRPGTSKQRSARDVTLSETS